MNSGLKDKIFYPAIHEADEQLGLVITTSGFQLISPGQHYPPEGHPRTHSFHYQSGRILNEYQLVYITRGQGISSFTGTNQIRLNEGTMFVLFPGIWHTYCPSSETGWEAYWVGFRGDYARNLDENKLLEQENTFFDIGYNETIVKLFQEIIEYSQREEPGAQALLGGIVMHMIGVLYHFRKNEVFSYKTVIPLINKAKVIMREHIASSMTAEEIAPMLNISYSWFRRTFKEYSGFTPAQFMIQLKVQKSKELLAQTNDSIKEIAIALNFESPDYFSVFFKRCTGFSPLAYRALCRVR